MLTDGDGGYVFNYNLSVWRPAVELKCGLSNMRSKIPPARPARLHLDMVAYRYTINNIPRLNYLR